MQLKPQIRQQLNLLLQREHLEEQELRLRHWMELEKFHKGLGELIAAAVENFVLNILILFPTEDDGEVSQHNTLNAQPQ